MLSVVEVQFKADLLLKLYCDCFKRRFGSECIMNPNEVMDLFKWAVTTLGFERAELLIPAYLSLEDEWLVDNGFPMPYFKKNINAIIARANATNKARLPQFVIAISMDSGHPVTHVNPGALEGHKAWIPPISLEEWKAADIETKLRQPKENWALMGCDVNAWIEEWKKQGWIAA